MKSKPHKVFKIRHRETGLFSKGGSSDWKIWTKEGKSWSNVGHVKNHLHMFLDYDGNKRDGFPYDNAELIEVEINYDVCFKTDLEELVSTMSEDRAKQEEKYRLQHEKWIKEQELKQLEELKKKYE